MKSALLTLLLFGSFACFAQEKELLTYLEAAQTPEAAASKKTMAAYSFGVVPDSKITGYLIIDTAYFVTDKPGGKGFKATLSCNIGETDINVNKQVVMFFDKKNEHWSVFSFGDAQKKGM